MSEETFEFTVDGATVEGRSGETVLSAAARAGIEIPTLCHDDRLDPMGSCRMCLVEVAGSRRLQPACTWKAAAGIEVKCETERVNRHRKHLLEMYLADHAAPETPEPFKEPNQVLALAERYGATRRFPALEAPREARADDAHLELRLRHDPGAVPRAGAQVLVEEGVVAHLLLRRRALDLRLERRGARRRAAARRDGARHRRPEGADGRAQEGDLHELHSWRRSELQ